MTPMCPDHPNLIFFKLTRILVQWSLLRHGCIHLFYDFVSAISQLSQPYYPHLISLSSILLYIILHRHRAIHHHLWYQGQYVTTNDLPISVLILQSCNAFIVMSTMLLYWHQCKPIMPYCQHIVWPWMLMLSSIALILTFVAELFIINTNHFASHTNLPCSVKLKFGMFDVSNIRLIKSNNKLFSLNELFVSILNPDY